MLLIFHIGDALVGAQPLGVVGDVVVGNANIEPEIEGGMDFQRNLFALQLLHGFFEQADVRVVADGFDVAVLLAAEQVARAAQFQIERGDFEAGTEIAEFFQRRKAFACDFAQLRIRGNKQIGVGAAVRAAHAAAQLVQLAQAVALGVLDDDGVGERDIEAVLDNGGARRTRRIRAA